MSVFSAGFCIFQRVSSKGVVSFHILKLRKRLFACKEKICLSGQKFVKYHEAANFLFLGYPINKNRVLIV